jgi:hypothetical protein
MSNDSPGECHRDQAEENEGPKHTFIVRGMEPIIEFRRKHAQLFVPKEYRSAGTSFTGAF